MFYFTENLEEKIVAKSSSFISGKEWGYSAGHSDGGDLILSISLFSSIYELFIPLESVASLIPYHTKVVLIYIIYTELGICFCLTSYSELSKSN